MAELALDPTPVRGGFDAEGFYRPSGYEVLTCWVGGFDALSPSAREPGHHDPRAGFEAALLPALQRSPCVVAFSGGRDSSAVLAVATKVARAQDLPDPIPATCDFAGRPGADEGTYQELLIRELGLREWHRFTELDACDVLGEWARRGLARYGLLWPAMVHCHAPFMQLAAGGGAIITGDGGDQVLGSQRMTVLNRVLSSRRPPDRRTLARLLTACGPAALRRRQHGRELSAVPVYPWLTDTVTEGFVREFSRDLAAEPLRWDAAVLRHARCRAATTAAANLRRVFAAQDVSYHDPFLDPAFLGPFSRAGSWRGWTSRTSMMQMLFGDVLPDVICSRTSKAEFGAIAIGAPSRDFIAAWDGSGVDPEIVDIAAFRAAVRAENPPYGVEMLLQALWLATEHLAGHRTQRPVA